MRKLIEKTISNTGVKKEEILTTKQPKSVKMRKLFDLGYTVKQISIMLEVRYNFVYNVISRYVLETDCKLDTNKEVSKKEQVIKMINEGASIKEIMSEVKVNVNYVYKIKKESLLEDMKKNEVAE
jgi:transposase